MKSSSIEEVTNFPHMQHGGLDKTTTRSIADWSHHTDPRPYDRNLNKVMQFKSNLFKNWSHEPTPEEVANEMGLGR